MKTVKEIKAFVEAYGRICAYVPEAQVEHIVFMLYRELQTMFGD